MDSEIEDKIPEECKINVTDPKASFFIEYKCESVNLTTHFSSYPVISRQTVTWVAVITDMLVCTLFCLTTAFISNRVHADMEKYRKNAFQLSDFSVKIKHLPKLATCADSDQLKAKLALHIA